jgi:hypothetical protein
MNNYIPDVNRFKLAGPPKWWLDKLWDFDSSLVVVPSRQDCVYRLAQRRKLNLSIAVTNDIMFKESDTQMLASYGLIPVTSILATANWSNPFMFEELRRRAPWRLGGAQKVADDLDAEDAKAELDKRAATDEHLTYLAKDSWNLYLKKIGVRSHMYSPKTKRSSAKVSLS